MINTIGKNHGHYQIEQNMVIVKKKTYGKKKEGRRGRKGGKRGGMGRVWVLNCGH